MRKDRALAYSHRSVGSIPLFDFTLSPHTIYRYLSHEAKCVATIKRGNPACLGDMGIFRSTE
jgi:hypothetical protein